VDSGSSAACTPIRLNSTDSCGDVGRGNRADFWRALERIVVDVRRNWLQNRLIQAGRGKNQAILHAMAVHDTTHVPLQVIADFLEQSSQQVRPDLTILSEREIVEVMDDDVYAFADPLLREFVRRFGALGVGLNAPST
jgi:hypothetical protein